ncbi:MFS transporter [Ferrimonas lipolytica]|uniref:MFS transporter n=1 Tax=Ferrimonas lipolytica TaxID=2724191 RepID=A0A6H1UF41_9GAMM|nr:MFS transporter [Ferrimonas lipolytica]QIZ76412.1 MFS transporter [Ferrimonas lipolytica]
MSKSSKRQLFGWAMFDVANSAYTTVVVTVVYSAFFVSQIVPQQSSWGNSWWALAMILSSAMAMLLAPLLGSWVDLYGGKKRLLLINMWLCASATASLYWVEPGMISLGLLLLIVSNSCWMLSEVFCASFLTDIADESSMGWISGLGWGLGYLGGLASLVMVLFGVVTSVAGEAEYIEQNQWAMVAVAMYFIIVSLPTMIWLPEPRGFDKSQVCWREVWHRSILQFQHSWALSKRLPVLFNFFIVFTIYSAGMATVIKFFGIFVEAELTLSAAEKTTVFLALQVSAFLGSVGFGLLESRLGPRLTVFLTLLWWLAGLVCIYQLQQLSELLNTPENTLFVVCTVVAGAGLGATQSASRTIVGLLTPAQHSGLMFGYWGMFARLAAIIGSAAFAMVADLVSTRQALLVIMLFFVVGAALVIKLPIEQGIKQANND